MSRPNSGDVLMAAVIGAHGIGGEVKLKSFARSAESLRAYGSLRDEAGRVFTLSGVREAGRGELIARFAEIKDRDAAEALKSVRLYVSRALLPATHGDEYYHADLIGLFAFDEAGRQIGQVTAVHNYGAGDVLAIESLDGAEILICFTRENVPSVDVKAGRLVVAVPNEIEAGRK